MLGLLHHAELQVYAGIQHVVCLVLVCREHERVNVHVRIDRLDLRHCIAADGIHCRFSTGKCGAGVVIAVRIRIRFCIFQQSLVFFCDLLVRIAEGGLSGVDIAARRRRGQSDCQRIPGCHTGPGVLISQVQRIHVRFALDLLAQRCEFAPGRGDLPAVFLEHILVVQDAGTVCHIRQTVNAVLRDKLQFVHNIHVRRLDVLHALKVRNVQEHICIQEVGIVDVAADADDVRIILTDKACFQHGHCLVGRFNGEMDVVVRCVEPFLHLLESGNRLRLVLYHCDFRFTVIVRFSCTARQQKSRQYCSRQNQTACCILFSHVDLPPLW